MDRLTEEGTSVYQRGAVFDEAYYRTGCGLPYLRNDHWLNFFGGIADQIIRSLKPRRVFDAGCALGMLVESFWDRGVEAYGADISPYAISNVRPDMRPYCRIGSLIEPLRERFDLITCIEVVEHMPEVEAQLAIENLTRASDCILFSSTPSDFTEPTHVNVHPTIYWLNLFAAQGFWPELLFDAGFVAPHAILFSRRDPRSYPEHDILGAFSEQLRIRTALVEREQRIGNLNAGAHRSAAQISSLKRDLDASATAFNEVQAALSDSDERLTKLTAELLAGYQQARAFQADLADARTRIEEKTAAESQLQAEAARLRESLAQEGAAHAAAREALRGEQAEAARLGGLLAREEAAHTTATEALRLEQAEAARLRESLAREEAAHAAAREALRGKQAEAARLGGLLAREEAAHTTATEALRLEQAAHHEMGLRFETAQTHSAAIETERDLLVATARNLQQDAAYIRQALGGVVSSPGWQAILKYRRWLWATYSTSRIIRDWYEPLARSIVQKLLTAGAPYNPELIPRLELATPALVPPLPRQDLAYERWIELAEPGPRQLALESRMAAQFSYRPKISVAVPVYKVSLEILRQMVDSVRRQTYDNWELCIAHGDPDDAPARSYLAGAAKEEGRIKVEFLSSNAGISKNSDSALNLCSGEFVALLDHDDTLAPFALFEVAQVLNDNPALDFIYSDKDQLSEDGLLRMDPLFKPQWSPDVMLSANYLTHLCVMRTTEIQTLSGWRSETDGAQDWDLFLRITERTSRIAHIPKVLYHWRRVASSVASGGLGAKPYAAKGQLRAIQDHLDRRGMAAGAAFTPSGLLRLQWRGARPSVSIIVVGSGIEGLSFYDSLQGMENGSPEVWIVPIGDTPVPIPPTRRFKILAGGGSASLAERLNLAARQCTGEVLIFLDSAVEPSGDDWVDELAYPLLDRGIGVVGAKLFDPQSSSIRHAGIAFDPEGALSHPFAGEHDYVWSQFGGANWYRNWTAVSGACFSTRREVFLQAGGFADRPQYPRLDVDFCLNVILTLNLRILYNPFARMWQGRLAALEQWRSADETAGPRCFLQNFPDGDPYFNPNVSCASGSISLRLPQRSTQGLDHNFSGEARDLVRIFDYTPADVQASSRPRGSRSGHSEHRFTWFIPQFGNPFYGGVHTILRFADYFQRAHRVRSTFVVLGHRRPARVAAQIARVSEGLAQTSNIRVISEYGALDTLEPSDASMATLWTTAYYLLRYNNTGRKFYFLQDYEPLFYPAGSTGALVESTYRFGFYGICNTAPLRDLYMHHGGKADFFEPCVDQSVFFEPLRHRAPDPYVLFCYARPGHSRNCFELLAEGLRKLKHRMGDKIAIITAGETWIPALFELDGIVHNLGLLDYRTTGAVYRMSHAGISMMMTRHPSYLPLELMASGSLVITNRNEHTQWLLHDRDNCLLTETSSSAIAEAVEEGLRNQALRDRITRNASEMIQRKYQNWDEQAEKVYQSIAGML